MTIKVSIQNNYGQQTVYPVCDRAKAFARIAGTRTLTTGAIANIKALGYEIELGQAVITL